MRPTQSQWPVRHCSWPDVLVWRNPERLGAAFELRDCRFHVGSDTPKACREGLHADGRTGRADALAQLTAVLVVVLPPLREHMADHGPEKGRGGQHLGAVRLHTAATGLRPKVIARKVDANVFSYFGLGLHELEGLADFLAVAPHTAARDVARKSERTERSRRTPH